MDLILILGSGAVGKMTVGQALMKITDFRNLGFQYLNHMEGGFFECANCGLTVRDERVKNGSFISAGRKAMYCKDCATEIHLQQRINSVMRARDSRMQNHSC